MQPNGPPSNRTQSERLRHVPCCGTHERRLRVDHSLTHVPNQDEVDFSLRECCTKFCVVSGWLHEEALVTAHHDPRDLVAIGVGLGKISFEPRDLTGLLDGVLIVCVNLRSSIRSIDFTHVVTVAGSMQLQTATERNALAQQGAGETGVLTSVEMPT